MEKLMDDDDLLSWTPPLAAPASAAPKAMSNARSMRKASPRERSLGAAPAKHAATGDFWCCMVLAFLAFGGYGLWNVPPRDRTLANFETKMRHIQRALAGDLDEENKVLVDKFEHERQNEMQLRLDEQSLRRQLVEAHQHENSLQRKLATKESSYEAAKRESAKTNRFLQNWHRKSDELQSRLALVQSDARQKHRDLERSQSEASQAEQRSLKLERTLANTRKTIVQLEDSQRSLQGRLSKEEQWHKDAAQKFRRFKDAEQSLIRSVDATLEDK